jgi:hypothetical protein
MRRRGIRKENANEGRRYFMTRKMKMMIREKGGVEVL